MKHLPLHELHRELGARFGAFAGYDMPLFYAAGVLKEHLHTRAQAGLFDISHMLHVDVTGADAARLVGRLCPYPAGGQEAGTGRYTFFLNEAAGIIDDLIVTRLGAEHYRIVCNAGCADKDLAHLRAHAAGFAVAVTPLSRAFLALQGPQAEAVLARAGLAVGDLAFMRARLTDRGWFVSRSGYTGEDGFEIALPLDDAEDFARSLLGDDGVMMVGLGARDSLRLEAGLPLYGQDLADDITPMEAGLAWAIPPACRRDGAFVGAAALQARFEEGPARKRVGLKPAGTAPVRAHAALLDAAGQKIGEVTSGGYGPSVGAPIAMGLIASGATAPIFTDLRGRRVEMAIVPLPFVPHRYKR